MCKFGMLWHMMKGEITVPRTAIRKIVLCAMFAALCCLSTMVIQVPSPLGGYLNLGDGFVLTGAFLLGPWYGALAGGLGSALADLLSGYVQYVPGTFLIKAGMAVIAGLLCRPFARHLPALPARLLAALPGECLMVLGYLLYEAWPLAYGAGALVGVTSNVMQAILGVVVSLILCTFLLKIPGVKRNLPGQKE